MKAWKIWTSQGFPSCLLQGLRYLEQIGKVNRDDTVEIVVVKTELLNLCQLRCLQRYAALEKVETEVQVIELGEAANG
ncbi:hypothetical protein Peur_012117 [Populus x canadensis]